ncbi:hypothetical protein KIPB_003684 [Kipferlia bialata]|uniref:Helicase ATP-binding domain-containing protein n=1 Tax=Kipferlia bialata TaxID=797122 RepID=A0A9K3GH79_9EUKA|nr:hypothetical protein KIPB_000926 [Kipferlia bialata]GIQ82527.1 hypothetical protein KIPB_003684 [Kipferlia bialata]|eukprot:g926.t1
MASAHRSNVSDVCARDAERRQRWVEIAEGLHAQGMLSGPASKRKPSASGVDLEDLLDCDLSEGEVIMLGGVGGELSLNPTGAIREDMEERAEALGRVVYASRTHSQVTQWILSLRKILSRGAWYRPPPVSDCGSPPPASVPFSPSLVPLASRRVLCCFDAARSLATSPHMLDDVCKRVRQRGQCPYADAGNRQRLSAWILMSKVPLTHDDIVKKGQELCACPFLSTRACIPWADIVTMPHASLLAERGSASSATSSGSTSTVCTGGSALLVDEAHGLMGMLESMAAPGVSREGLGRISSAVGGYLTRRGRSIHHSTAMTARHIIRLCDSLSSLPVCGVTPLDTLLHTEVCSVDLSMVKNGLGSMRFMNILRGSAQGEEEGRERQTGRRGQSGGSTPTQSLVNMSRSVLVIADMLQQMSTSAFYHVTQETVSVFTLKPGTVFRDIVSRYRSTMLMGGTLSPIPAFTQAVLGEREGAEAATQSGQGPVLVGLPLTSHSYSSPIDNSRRPIHIVAGDSPSSPLMVTHKTRGPALTLRIGTLLCTLIRAVDAVSPNTNTNTKGTVAVFVPSYADANALHTHIMHHVGVPAVTSSVYLEAPGLSLPQVRPRLIIGVMGGKLSEGVDLRDEWCRLCVVVGVPFPALGDPRVRARAEGEGGKEWYLGQALRSVRQTVGRAVRHTGDWGMCLLVDERYTSDRLKVVDGPPSTVYRDTSTTVSGVQQFMRLHRAQG